MSEQNKVAVQRIFERMNAAQSMSEAAQQVAPGFVVHLPGMPPLDVHGFEAFGNSFFAACPGLIHEVLDPTAEGERVAVRLRISGMHTQPFVMPNGTVPPTGKELVIEAMNMFRFVDGKVAEQWVHFDMLGVMQTLGVIPS